MPIGQPISRLRLFVLSCHLLAAFSLTALDSPAQIATSPRTSPPQTTPQPQPGTSDRLHGVVLNSLTGKPVPRVLVTSLDNRFAALTDSEGRFAFDLRRPLAPGTDDNANIPLQLRGLPYLQTTTVNLRKPGFITRPASFNIPLYAPSSPEPELRLKITPAATLTGHLSTDLPQPSTRVSVQLRRRQIADGLASWIPAGSTRTDSQGNFRFPELSPGDYKLLAQDSVTLPANGQTPTASVPGSLPAFFPDATSLDAADSIHLSAGESSSANLALRSAPFYRITIPLTHADASFGIGLSLSPDTLNGSLSANPQTHTVEGFLPTGTYTLRISSGNQTRAVASVPLTVADAPLTLPPVALHPAADLPVVVHRDFTEPLPNGRPATPVILNLQPLDTNGQYAGPGPPKPGADPDDIRIANLTEGVYRVEAHPVLGYIAALTSGVTDLLRDPLVVGPGGATAPIEVTLRNDSATLKVTIQQPAPPDASQSSQPTNALILVLPLDQPNRPAAQSFFQSSNPYPQTFRNLAPGRYLVLVEPQSSFRQNDLEFRNPKVLETLLTQGATITLSANQTAEIQVPPMPSAPEDTD